MPLDLSEISSDYIAMHEHKSLIEKLGGRATLATAIWGELDSETLAKRVDLIRKWEGLKNGIPWKYRPLIADLADEKRVRLPSGFIFRAGKAA